MPAVKGVNEGGTGMYEKISIDPTKYIVLDLETNGLRAKKDDVLSLSIYKPDDGKVYNRFFPLELSTEVRTTKINGIVKKDLIGATPLTQSEFDQLAKEFDFGERIILTYAGGSFDERFLEEYLKRHRIRGFEYLKFYNFKRQIISSRFSDGNISKDNLCKLFGIENVQKIHTGVNDCILEWELFVKLGGDYYLVTSGEGYDNVFRLSSEYIIPVSLLFSHPNLGKLLKTRPYVECTSKEIITFTVPVEGIEKFGTNFDGVLIEHLLDSMLQVENVDSKKFLVQNKSKLEYIGRIENSFQIVPMVFNEDGTVTAVRRKDIEKEREINNSIEAFRRNLQPLVDFIKQKIFCGKKIKSQEVVIDKENNILALCDLSSEECVLEIKTNGSDPFAYREQLFYEANGRKCYYLCVNWEMDYSSNILKQMFFKLYKVELNTREQVSEVWTEGKRAERRAIMTREIEGHLEGTSLTLIKYTNVSVPVLMKCKVCGKETHISYSTLMKKKPGCRYCSPYKKEKIEGRCLILRGKENRSQTNRHHVNLDEARKRQRGLIYSEKITKMSEGRLVVSNYVGAKDNVDVKCEMCGYKWSVRADHLLGRCRCPQCRLRER